MTTRDRVIEQIKLQEDIQRLANINIVNCGSCGSVVLHKRVPLTTEHSDITCPYCNFISEPCDFPDFLYSGLENNTEFN